MTKKANPITKDIPMSKSTKDKVSPAIAKTKTSDNNNNSINKKVDNIKPSTLKAGNSNKTKTVSNDMTTISANDVKSKKIIPINKNKLDGKSKRQEISKNNLQENINNVKSKKLKSGDNNNTKTISQVKIVSDNSTPRNINSVINKNTKSKKLQPSNKNVNSEKSNKQQISKTEKLPVNNSNKSKMVTPLKVVSDKLDVKHINSDTSKNLMPRMINKKVLPNVKIKINKQNKNLNNSKSDIDNKQQKVRNNQDITKVSIVKPISKKVEPIITSSKIIKKKVNKANKMIEPSINEKLNIIKVSSLEQEVRKLNENRIINTIEKYYNLLLSEQSTPLPNELETLNQYLKLIDNEKTPINDGKELLQILAENVPEYLKTIEIENINQDTQWEIFHRFIVNVSTYSNMGDFINNINIKSLPKLQQVLANVYIKNKK